MKPIILVPGYTGSGPDHWQTHWERGYPSSRRVENVDWDNPNVEQWVQALDDAVEQSEDIPVIAAHSLGCYVVAHWAARSTHEISGALLVAPPDLDQDHTEVPLKRFSPFPQQQLPFTSILAASTDDPFCTVQRSKWLAELWGSRLEVLGAAGRVNTASGFGNWPEGEWYLRQLMGSTTRPRLRQVVEHPAASKFLI